MAINFAAANMAGYNNPEIEIVTLKLGADSKPVGTIPTYETIHDIFRRGAIPFLAITDSSKSLYMLLAPIQYTGEMIAFSIITLSGDTSKPLKFTSVTLAKGTPPNIQIIVFGGSIK